MKIISAHQSTYLPWLGYYHRIAVSDIHVILDHVQFEKNSYTNRNIIFNSNGKTWLTVPVKTKGKFNNIPIREIEIDNTQKWKQKHWKTIYNSYSKAPYFSNHKDFFASIYDSNWKFLFDLNQKVNNYILSELNIHTKLVYSSELKVEQKKDVLVLELCKKNDATSYYSGALGRNYLHEKIFSDNGINIVYQDYKHPTYKQNKTKLFEPNIAVIDLLFNCGPDSKRIILSGNINKKEINKHGYKNINKV